MANEAKSIKPIDIDYNRPTQEFVSNIMEFGGEISKLADLLNSLFDFTKDFTGDNDDGDDNVEEWTGKDKDINVQLTSMLQQLEKDYKASKHDITLIGEDSGHGIQRLNTGNENTRNLFNFVYNELNKKHPGEKSISETGYTIRDSPKSKALHFMKNIMNEFLQKNISLIKCCINVEQLIYQIEKTHCIPRKTWNGAVWIENVSCPPVKFSKFDNKLTEETEELEAASYRVKLLDTPGFINIATAVNEVNINANTVTANNEIYYSNDNKVALEAFTAFINQLTNGRYQATIEPGTSIEKIVYSVTRECTLKKMPKVFTAFNKYYGNVEGVLNAAIMLMSFAKTINNSELMNEILNSDIGPQLNNYLGNIDQRVLDNYHIDDSIGEQQYQALYDKLKASIENVNPDWNITDDNLLTTNELDNSHINTLLTAISLVNDTSSLEDIDELNNEAYLATANLFDTLDPFTSLRSEFPQLSITA